MIANVYDGASEDVGCIVNDVDKIMILGIN